MKYTIIQIKEQFNERDYNLLDSEYINQNQHMHFICNKHKEYGIQSIMYSSFRYRNNGCKYCAKEKYNKKIDINEVIKRTETKGLQFVSFEYITGATGLVTQYVKFVCPSHEYVGVQKKSLGQITTGKYGCNYCNNVLDTFTFKEKLKRKNINHFDVMGEYFNQNTRIKLKCKKHGTIYTQVPRKIFEGVNACPDCISERIASNKLLSLEEAQKKLHKIKPMIDIIGNYHDTFTPVKLHCKDHNYEFTCAINNYLYKGKHECCPKCTQSYGERLITLFLDKYKFKYIEQKTFDKCIDKQLLSYDFYLPNENICIEFQGEQHYKPIDYFGGEERYKKQKIHDKIKKKYCKENQIKLIEVPYWEKENIDIFLWEKLKENDAIVEIA